ncbi:MAG TPA: PPK2 family polyphosphate kinase [Gemmatimonadales bacterium]|nr:PPK2 family polyphosphate kinase [Gemmatimonadales bacterium]
MLRKKELKALRVPPGGKFRLADRDPGKAMVPELDDRDKAEETARRFLRENLDELSDAQETLWANDVYSVLVVLQAMDTAGKDGIIKHVMSGINPQGCEVTSFKRPSEEELDHTYLWRCMKALPERGKIGIFNRSYYEEVLVVRVHPEILARQKLPAGKQGKKFWAERYDDINRFERHLVRNGTIVLKLFLHISKKEQRKRLLARLENPDKHWKFELADLGERKLWDQYAEAYEEAIAATSTPWAPWYVIPADHKWPARALVAQLLTTTITRLRLKVPEVPKEQLRKFAAAKRELTSEGK